MKNRIMTYKQYGSLLDKLVYLIETDPDPIVKNIKNVVGIYRGGLPIAVHLSHYFSWNYIDEYRFNMYNIELIGNTLIVDDIADTGKTLNNYTLNDYNYSFPTATLFYKKRSIIQPTFYVETTDKWIVFPWEGKQL
jgi:hypoxanthine phosphoribosyltransferase